MKLRTIILLTVSFVGVISSPTWAESTDSAIKITEQSVQSMSTGEIKKIDKEQGKITIKHGELKNLGMPPMTMVFHVKDLAMLDKVKIGQQIKFIAENVNGALTVVKIN